MHLFEHTIGEVKKRRPSKEMRRKNTTPKIQQGDLDRGRGGPFSLASLSLTHAFFAFNYV
jgi:hypothetical protein